jgi:hypothetical protein
MYKIFEIEKEDKSFRVNQIAPCLCSGIVAHQLVWQAKSEHLPEFPMKKSLEIRFFEKNPASDEHFQEKNLMKNNYF